MTKQEAIEAYVERFGGFPYYLFMTATDDYIIWEVRRALRRNRRIEPKDGSAY